MSTLRAELASARLQRDALMAHVMDLEAAQGMAIAQSRTLKVRAAGVVPSRHRRALFAPTCPRSAPFALIAPFVITLFPAGRSSARDGRSRRFPQLLHRGRCCCR